MNLVFMTLSLLPQGIVSVGRVLAIVRERPGVTLGASVIRLISFLLAGGILTYWYGSLGASLAVIIGAGLKAAYYLTRWRELVPVSWRSCFLTLGLGVMFVPLIWLKSSLSVNLCLSAIAVVGYAGSLLLFGLWTPGEVARAWLTMVARKAPPYPNIRENE